MCCMIKSNHRRSTLLRSCSRTRVGGHVRRCACCVSPSQAVVPTVFALHKRTEWPPSSPPLPGWEPACVRVGQKHEEGLVLATKSPRLATSAIRPPDEGLTTGKVAPPPAASHLPPIQALLASRALLAPSGTPLPRKSRAGRAIVLQGNTTLCGYSQGHEVRVPETGCAAISCYISETLV